MAHRTLLVPLFVLLCILVPSELSGQVTPVTGPFEVSPRSYGFDVPGRYRTHLPSLAALSDGSFVVAWDENLDVDFEGSTLTFFDIYVRQIRAGGRPGRLARVDRATLESDRSPETPELAGDGRGGFTLVWTRSYFGGADLLYQHAGPGGFVEGSISPEGEGAPTSSAVAANAAGDWVIAWEEDPLDGTGRRHVGLRAFRASGEPSSPEIRLRPADPNVSLSTPRVAVMADRFVVVWGASGGPRPPVLQGRLFALDGTSLSPVFQIGRLQGAWDVLTDEEDSFQVAWRGPSPGGPLIRISHYTMDGILAGTAPLGTSSGNWGIHMNRRGEIAFVWTEPDGRVLLQVLDRLLVPKGPRQWVTRAVDEPWAGDVVISDTGKILVVWVSSVQVTTAGGARHHPLVGKLWQVEE